MPGTFDPQQLLETVRAHRAAAGTAAGALVVVVGVALYLSVRGPDVADAPPADAPPPDPPAVTLDPEPDPVDEPDAEPVALDASDPLVRELLPALTAHPRVAAWLATDGLVRRFVVAVDNVADGSNPARHVPFLRPGSRIATRADADGGRRIDAASFGRYDDLARLAGALDAEGAADIYHRLLPLLDEAYQELGYPGASFTQAFRRAVVRVLETPAAAADPRVVSVATFFAYEDERLEELPPVQKQLLLMGPDNLRAVQSATRAIAAAIGIRDLPPGPAAAR